MSGIITLIAAVADNGVIGQDGAMPWHVPGEQKGFKAATMGKPMVMGRTTFESTGPLPGRRSIVLTRDPSYRAAGADVAHSVDEAMWLVGDDDLSVVGGAQIYAEFMHLADRLLISRIPLSPDGDTYFPAIDQALWRVAGEEPHTGWTVVAYERVKPRTHVEIGDGVTAGAATKIGASCAIVDDDRLLLTRREDNGLWCLPGGGVEPGETWSEAAVREVREETGLAVQPDSVLAVYTDPTIAVVYADGRRRQVFGVCLRARVTDGSAGLSDEVIQVGWFTQAEAERLPIIPLHRPLVRAAFEPAERPARFV